MIPRPRRRSAWAVALLLNVLVLSAHAGDGWVKDGWAAGDFPLVRAGTAAPLWYSPGDYTVVARATADLAGDVERVTGHRPEVLAGTPLRNDHVVLVGTLGRSPLIDELVAAGRLEVTAVAGQWETFLITTVPQPWPAVKQALVIVGSDRRGTAFGVYELAQAIGVSPWHWWADVPPRPRPELAIAPGARRQGPPSVRYRGIFINDEDWGLQPWAAHTHEPENADIGPKTYQRVFELLLRLKANTLWPAMHPSTRPFNDFPANARLADDYGIVMGSSHAEPMLRNNVREWQAPAADYNFLSNRSGVLRYWEERLEQNGRFENIYTLGMRGIHDSQMLGPRTDPERIATLQQVFQEQRDLMTRHVPGGVDGAAQMFCAYKEVLDLYRQGLEVPEDVTIVWPDDNFGYIRNFAGPDERGRSGGFGVYYHASYLGRPLAYLWLCTTPPALIWEEMIKAYEHGADRMWILNVGDLKPAEIATEFFLQLAWDINRWDETNLPDFLRSWARREFGPGPAEAIANVLERYYVLNFQRKPEHLQWWLPGETPRPSPLTPDEVEARLQAFERLRQEATAVADQLDDRQRDAFFQLVLYPVTGSAEANTRYFHAEQYARNFNHHLDLARRHAAAAHQADTRLRELTGHFDGAAGGKWRHFMVLEPADNQWRSMRIAPLPLPAPNLSVGVTPAAAEVRRDDAPPAAMDPVTVLAGDYRAQHAPAAARWVEVPGLGRSGRAVTIRPSTSPSLETATALAAGPWLEYHVDVSEPGEYQLEVQLLPTHALVAGRPLRIGLAVNDAPPQIVAQGLEDGSPQWAQGVLDGVLRRSLPIEVRAAGPVRLRLHMVDAGVVVDRLILYRGAPPRSYFGPLRPAGPPPR